MKVQSNLDLRILKANSDIGARNYWKKLLADHVFGTYFQDRHLPETAAAGPVYSERRLTAPEEVSRCLAAFMGSDKDWRSLLVAALGILAYNCSPATDIVLFTPVQLWNGHAGRDRWIIPVRLQDFAGIGFAELQTTVKQQLNQGLRYGNYPLEKMLEKEAGSPEDIPMTGILVDEQQPDTAFGALRPALVFSFMTGDVLSLDIRYKTATFGAGYIDRIAGLYFSLLFNLVTRNYTPVGEVDLLSAAERELLIHGFNPARESYPSDETIVSLFERQVRLTPESIALVYEGRRLSYRELNERSNRLAHYLRNRYRLGPDHLVAIVADRSAEMVIGLLGILKSGSAYIPIDPAYPAERIAYILEDSGARVMLTDKIRKHIRYAGEMAYLDAAAQESPDDPERINAPGDLCYMIYTSGSSGRPKGVMISHYNVVNFIAAMSRQFPPDGEDCMLAVTSISFDISVLELFWTLCCGTQVVLHPADISLNGLDRYLPGGETPMDFSLFFFSSYNYTDQDKYNLLLESVRYADQNGFRAVWTPERHFHEFGGLYPNPAVISAALAMITRRIELRSGSVVATLHDPIRIAEEWAVVDNLSGGRVGLSFAPGWNPNDFALSRGRGYQERQKDMYEKIETVRKLWSGGAITRKNGNGQETQVSIFPAPLQKELPVWVTSSGSEETFRSAGRLGAHLLTHLLGQEIDDLAGKIRLYREAWSQSGHAGEGKVTLMLHTFVGEDIGEVEKLVEQPFIDYLKSSIGLTKILMEESGLSEEDLGEEKMQVILKNAFNRYYKTSALIGTKGSCSVMIGKLKAIGVNEMACLIDFGVEAQKVMEALDNLKELKELFNGSVGSAHLPVTLLQSTPSFMKLALEGSGSKQFLRALRLLLLGGEALPASLVKSLRVDTGATICNMYGPTETTVWSCMGRVEGKPDRISIGQPILNTQVYILDQRLRLVPVGMTGFLYIGGEGLSRGYWKQPELTATKFIDNPFEKGSKIYNTGDLASWRPDGHIELVGREDQQVKIRGYRIELGEIENCLLGHRGVTEAVVIARGADEEKHLAGFFVEKEGAGVTAAEIKDFLASRLPAYMVPSFLMSLPYLPLTPNGKIDRKALPEAGAREPENYTAPSSETEKRLARIWSAVLHIDVHKIGTQNDFFSMGGHSITAVRLIFMIEQEFSVVVQLRDIFANTTVGTQSRLIENSGSESVGTPPVMEKREFYLVSSAQERLFYDQLQDPGNLNNNNASAYEIRGKLDMTRLRRAFEQLVSRHDGLRTRFGTVAGEVVQFINEEATAGLLFFDQAEYGDAAAAFCTFVRPFDLSRVPLIRYGIYCQAGEERYLFVDIHHVVCDGVSVNVLMNDFKNIYEGRTLPPTGAGYIDYARWQRGRQKALQKERDYWEQKLTGELPRIRLSVVSNAGSLRAYPEARKVLILAGEQYRKLKRSAIDLHATDFMLLLAIHYLLLYKLSGNTDIIIGTDALGRTKSWLKHMVGTFINVLPLRLEVEPDLPFDAFLAVVKTCVVEAFDNQEFQYDQMASLVGRSEQQRLAQFYFSTADFLENEAEISDLQFVPARLIKQGNPARYELELNMAESNGEMRIHFIYSTGFYDETTIGLFMRYYEDILMAAIDNSSSNIDEVLLLADPA